jgi:rhamnogalacturonyl hydrolase YesR
MFAYCLLKGVRLGYLSSEATTNMDASVSQADGKYIDFRAAGVKAYNGCVKQFIKVNPDKTISLTNCCAVSGLGPDKNPKRDGSFDYYMSEPIRDNDAKGVAPFIWASLEMERDGYRVQNWK